MSKLTDNQVQEIRSKTYDKHIVKTVMDEYDLTYMQAWAVLTSTTYATVGGKREPLPPQVIGKRSGKVTLEHEQIEEIVNSERYWGMQTYFASKFGVSRTTVQRILKEYT